jgi:tRNA-Thr(GGU) m(6)t(6)A37 methyltransferase TsaA
MTQFDSDLRPGEMAVSQPGGFDAGVWFIGRLRTPWTRRSDCPKHGDPVNGPDCRIELDPRWTAALAGLSPEQPIQCLYWMDQARRDLVLQSPRRDGSVTGTFALRSPVRPNPIASSTVALLAIDGAVLTVRGLDCLDGTPLIDLKPDPRCLL